MERRFNVATDRRGNAISGATVTIKTPSGATATIYSDDGVTTTDNPLTTNADGEYTYFAPNGKYTEQIVKDGYGTEVLTDTVLFDPASINEVTTATYTLSRVNVGQWIEANTAGTATYTVSTASGYTELSSTIFRQKGAGQLVLSAGSKVKLQSSESAKTRAQYSVIGLTMVDSDEGSGTAVYSVFGDRAAS